jgi:hypothetical protein
MLCLMRIFVCPARSDLLKIYNIIDIMKQNGFLY